MNINQRLLAIKEQREWDRVNPDNPICPGCDRREHPARMIHTSSITGSKICPECLDDEFQLLTGCRWGEFNCHHDDCKV